MFKVGDEVVCVNDKNCEFIKADETYTVIARHPKYPLTIVVNTGGYYSECRFKKVDSK